MFANYKYCTVYYLQQQRIMSAAKHRPPYFYSPLKVQSDQKDVIITHLKEEIYNLKKNEQQFYALQDQYMKLQHRYKLLIEEKGIADTDFKERHNLSLRNICQLKKQIDALRAELRQKNPEIDDLETDQHTLKQQLDQKLIDIEKLKNELQSLLADNQELLNEKARFQQASNGIRKDNQHLLGSLKSLQLDNDSVGRKIDDLEKYHSQLQNEERLLKDKILAYQNENNSLDADITATIDDIALLNDNLGRAHADVNDHQRKIADMAAFSQKHKSQALHYQRSVQSQTMKNNDLSKQLSQAQNLLRVRQNQGAEGRDELAHLEQENLKLDKSNLELQEDLQNCRKHLENLGMLNSELVVHLQHFNADDEIARNLIDRRARVAKARQRVEETDTLVKHTSTFTSSPQRRSKGY